MIINWAFALLFDALDLPLIYPDEASLNHIPSYGRPLIHFDLNISARLDLSGCHVVVHFVCFDGTLSITDVHISF